MATNLQQILQDKMQEKKPATSYAELRAVDVSKHVEKKNGLSYLSWAWAVDQLLQRDPQASWSYKTNENGQPLVYIGKTAMVFCTVQAFGVCRTAQLPVMNHSNKAIPEPDAFAVNVAMQRCLAKAIALHGIGLYIYAGEDLPEPVVEQAEADLMEKVIVAIRKAETLESLRGHYAAAYKTFQQDKAALAAINEAKEARKAELSEVAA